MEFRNLLAKYKDGKATDEEVKLVEKELEKYEAIEEYLYGGCNIGFEKDILQKNLKEETAFIKKGVNKKFIKIVSLAVTAVFLILFTILSVAAPIVDKFYYNPALKSISGEHEDLYFDLRVFTELNLPGYAISGGITSESLGFGVHNISFSRINIFKGETKYINAKIKRNMRIGGFKDFFPENYLGFYSINSPGVGEKFLEERNKEFIGHLKELSPVSYISSYITFEKDLTLKEFHELEDKYNNKVDFTWVGIRTETRGKPIHYLSGFNPNFNNGSVSDDSADKNKYPYLQLVDWITDENNHNKHDMAEAYTKHFTSLLTYMNDRQKAMKALDVNEHKGEYYKNALDYVKRNGLNTYGALVQGEARYLLEFINNEKIKEVEINNVLPSKYRY